VWECKLPKKIFAVDGLTVVVAAEETLADDALGSVGAGSVEELNAAGRIEAITRAIPGKAAPRELAVASDGFALGRGVLIVILTK
jgi:hypothetical protein